MAIKDETLQQHPNSVAILGLGPSLGAYVNIAKRLGARSKLVDEVWGINAVADVIQCDRVFHMDDCRIQEIRAAARPESNIAAMLVWLKTHKGPIYTSTPHPGYPGTVAYPLQDVMNDLRMGYFNSTAAYAVAYAVHTRISELHLYGFDFTYQNVHDAEKGRACVEFWLGVAHARGIKLHMPRETSLFDACNAYRDRFYGYDLADVKLCGEPGAWSVTLEDVKDVPTADEIEARYDHSAHPNPLMEAVP